MRFKTKPEPKFLERRLIDKFLLFPKKLNNEIRWLEHVQIEQQYYIIANKGYTWIDRKFINEKSMR